MLNTLLQSWKPHLIAIGAFFILTVAYFLPVLQGKEIKQGDYLTWYGSAKEILDNREKGEEVLWTNSMFGGMPAYQISVEYPNNWMSQLNSFFQKILFHPGAIVFLCMVGFYFMLIAFGVMPWISAMGAIAFALSSYFLIAIEAGHNTKGYAIAYMAPVVMGMVIAYRRSILAGTAITALGMGLEIAANHLQITYYLGILCLFVVASEAVRSFRTETLPHFIKASGALLLAVILAVLPNITNLWVTYEYGEETTRGKSELTDNIENKTSGLDKDYATSWSYGIGETMTLLIPNYKGGGSGPIGNNESALKGIEGQTKQIVPQLDSYFGDQPFTSGPVYVGAIICFLFILGLLVLKGPFKWFLLSCTVLSIMLAWGRHFMDLTDFFLTSVPGYNKFRTVSMTLVIAEFTMPLIAALALQKIIDVKDELKANLKPLYIAAGATAGLCLLMYVMPDMFNDFFKEGEYEQWMGQLKQYNMNDQQAAEVLSGWEQARKNIFQADALRSFFFIALALVAIWLFITDKIKTMPLLASITALVLIDLWMVDRRYLNNENFVSERAIKNEFLPTTADQQILADKDPNYRVLNVTVNTFNNATTSYFHKSIGGYHGAKLKRYQELIEHHISKNNMRVLNMLNTKYFIVPDENKQPVAQMNPGALGHAWFVKNVQWVPNADAEIKALETFDPATTAVIDQRFKNTVSNVSATSAGGEIRLEQYKPNYLKYTATTSAASLAVFSEIYYNSNKGWQAYLNGKPAEHVRANYVLRAMAVPAGTHSIEFKFEPKSYYTGEKIALAGSIAVFALVIAACAFYFRRKKAEAEQQPAAKK